MNHDIQKMLTEITKLDSWDIQSVLGGVNFVVQQAAINKAVSLLPDLPPEGSGIDGYTPWEQKVHEPEIKEACAPIVGIANQVKDVLNEYTAMQPSEYDKVLEWLLQRPPTRAAAEAEYNTRKRLGMRPGMPMPVFVESVHAGALKRFENLKAKGEAAVRFLHGVDGNDADAPEWLYQSIHDKVQVKLAERWLNAEIRRTNPKITQHDRDLAAANQRLIEDVITELGGVPPEFSPGDEIVDDADALLKKK